MAGGRREFDGEATVFDRVRRLSALARFGPDEVDPATLADVLDAVGGRYRRDVADAIEHYSLTDPAGIATERATLLAEIDDYGGTAGESLARAIGHTALVDDAAVEVLADRLADGSRPTAAAEGLAVAAEIDPDAVAERLSTLLAALDSGPAVVDPLSRVLAELYVADVTDDAGAVRPRIRRALDADDPDERTGAVWTICRAAPRSQTAVHELHRVIHTLAAGGGFFSPDDDLDEVVLAGTREVAAERPHALVAHVDTLQELSLEDDDREADVRAILVEVAAASPPVFERLLADVEPGDGWLSRMRSGVGDDPRARAVLSGAAPAHVDVLVRRDPAVRAMLSEYPGLVADLVAAVAEDRPGAVEWAIDPLLERLDDSETEPESARRLARTLGTLARTYPPVAGTVVDRLASAGNETCGRALLTTRSLARTAPAALAGTSGPDGESVERLLVDAVPTGDGGTDAAFALATLGARYPDRLAAVAEDVADAVRASSYRPASERNRAVNGLAAETVRAAPEQMHSLGLTVLNQVDGEVDPLLSPEDANGLVALLGALCGEYDRYADRLVEWLEAAEESEVPGLLAVFAAAGENRAPALTDHYSTLSEATRRLDDDERGAATAALAGAVAADPDPPSTATARLVDLLYDNSPAVRRGAAFGVGEWLASVGPVHEEPVHRLSLVADADEGTPVADLALVRAGVRPAGENVEALERAAGLEYRAIARTAVAELGTVDRAGVPERIRSIRDGHVDPWVRAAAAAVDESLDRR